MISKETLLQVIYEQRNYPAGETILRKIDTNLINSPEVLIITGIRRCGKSTLLRQIQQQLTERDYYLNFDDERLINFTTDDFQALNQVLHTEFGEQHTYYFDEIQNIRGWERFISRLYNAGNKIFITGSNANMLSRELGTLLTGRHITKELYPFSFAEFLEQKQHTIKSSNLHTTNGRAQLNKLFTEYLRTGGIPQYTNSLNTAFLKSL